MGLLSIITFMRLLTWGQNNPQCRRYQYKNGWPSTQIPIHCHRRWWVLCYNTCYLWNCGRDSSCVTPGTAFPKLSQRPPGHGGDTTELCSLRFHGGDFYKCFIHWTEFLNSTHPPWDCILLQVLTVYQLPPVPDMAKDSTEKKRDNPKLQQCGQEAKPGSSWVNEELTESKKSHIHEDSLLSSPRASWEVYQLSGPAPTLWDTALLPLMVTAPHPPSLNTPPWVVLLQQSLLILLLRQCDEK